MKHIIEFNLPEERNELLMHTMSQEFFLNLLDIYNHCRSRLKHGDLKDNEILIFEEIRDMITEKIWDLE